MAFALEFFLRRISQGVLIVLAVAFVIFTLLRIAPGDPTRIMIVEGDTGCSLSPQLFDAGVTKTADAFCKLLVKNDVSPTLIPGIYQLHEQMSFEAIIVALEDPANLLDDAALRELTIERSVQAASAALGVTVDPLPTALPAPYDASGFALFDREFFDAGAMSEDDIAAFLDSHAFCAPGSPCLTDSRHDHTETAANAYCRAVPAGDGTSTAGVIGTVADACGINPKLLLVLLGEHLGLDIAQIFAESATPIADGGFLISDEEFFDAETMTADEIQAFLDARLPACSPGFTCLNTFTQDHPDRSADRYCAQMSGGSGETAAQIIHKAAVACDVNPQVLLIMLEKEQALVTKTDPEPVHYEQAMGFDCPDTGPDNAAACNAAYAGLATQVYRAARQMQIYTAQPGDFNYRAGRVNTVQWHPAIECGTSEVYIQNQATANLYIYTPYRANIAGLAAGRGIGDACTSSGNRNFYNLYIDWFHADRAPFLGAPAQIPACTVPPAEEIVADGRVATVTTDDLNARHAPTTQCGRDLTKLAAGTTVTVTGTYGAWSRADVNGSTVWVSTQYLAFG